MELKIKKQWLISSLFYFTFLILSCLPNDPYLSFVWEFGSKTWIIPFGYLVIETLNFLGLFLFSYKKNGTTLLSWNMLVSLSRICGVGLLLWVAMTLWILPPEVLEKVAHESYNQLPAYSPILVLYLLLHIQWFVFSYRLRKANKSLKMKELLAQPEHQQVIQELQAIHDLEQLSNNYGRSVQSHPQIAGELKKIYTQRKLELTKT